MKDQNKFKQVMTLLCENYGRELTPALLKVYWTALRDEMSDDEFAKRAMSLLKGSRFFPKVADFLEFDRLDDEDLILEAEKEFRNFINALGLHGVYSSYETENPIVAEIVNDMGGVVAFNVDLDQLRWLKKDFVAAYKMRVRKGYSRGENFVPGIASDGEVVKIGSDAKSIIAIEGSNSSAIERTDSKMRQYIAAYKKIK